MHRVFDLGLPAGEPQAEFLAHFNACLKEIQESGSGTASFKPDGSFVSTSISRVRIGDVACHLSFMLHTQPDGVLSHLEVGAVEQTAGDWERAVESLVRTALTRALSRQKMSFFHRHRLSYFGANLQGEYWIGRFRLAPAIPDDPEPYLMNAERILYLDFHIDAADQHQSFVLAQEFTQVQIARLALLVDFPLLIPDLTMRWVLPPASADNPEQQSARLETHFRPTNPPPSVMPRKGELSPAGSFHGSLHEAFRLTAGELVTLPKETRRVFRAIAADQPFQQSVDACARMYHLSLLVRRYSVSASLAYRVAAIEAVCRTFGMDEGPSDFMRRYLPPTPGLDTLLDILYGKVRSGHFHQGQVPLDQLGHVPFHPFFNSEFVVQSQIADQGFWFTRKALVSWLLEEVEKRVAFEAQSEHHASNGP